MRKLKITADMLEDFNACQGSINMFRDTFPDGIEVTDDQQENFALIIEHQDRRVSIRYQDTSLCGRTTTGDDFLWLAKALIGESPYVYCRANSGAEFYVAGALADAVGVYLNAQEA